MNKRPTAVSVSILVKALNEEDRIGRCLAAAVREAASVDGEVILADSLSWDRTVEIARQFPVRIVRMMREEDRGCGAATQLGYPFARGDYICLVDGDMELEPGFVKLAVDYLKAHERVAGVGGVMIDTQIITPADRRRVADYSKVREPTRVSHLGGGGVYRRSAIESVQYLANRWLQACEEADLGLRLGAKGWELVRLPVPAVRHTGHRETAAAMIRRLWRTGRMSAYGVFLRYALGKPWWWRSVRIAWFVLAAPLLHAGAGVASVLIGLGGVPASTSCMLGFASVWGATFVALCARKRSLSDAVCSIVSWHLSSVAALRGFLGTPRDPLEPIPAVAYPMDAESTIATAEKARGSMADREPEPGQERGGLKERTA